MASRKQETSDRLKDPAKPAGWQEQFAGDAGEPAKGKGKARGTLKRKTYLMTDALIARVDAFAQYHGVGINEAARFIIEAGLEAIDAGYKPVETQVITKRTLGV